MSALLPAVLLGAGTAIAVGLPAPRREAVLGARVRRTCHLPPAALPVAVAAVLALPIGLVGASVAAVLSLVARRALQARRTSRAQADERRAAAESLSVLVGELRAGRAPAEALRRAAEVAVGPAAEAFNGGATSAAFGGPVAAALCVPADRSAVPETLRGLAACWTVCQGTGSSLADAVERLEDGLRAERRTRQEVEAELAGPRSTALLLATLPALGLLMAGGLGAHPLHTLLHTPAGNGCLLVGTALDLAGVAWARGVVRAASGHAT